MSRYRHLLPIAGIFGVTVGLCAYYQADDFGEGRVAPERPDRHSGAPVAAVHSEPNNGRKVPSVRADPRSDPPAPTTAPGADYTQRAHAVSALANRSDVNEAAGEFDPSRVEVDISTVGTSFPVSPSILRRCSPASNEGEPCWRLQRFLKNFSEEPRDTEWAASAEQLLRTYLSETESNRYRLRALECRLTLCAMEVESADAFVSAEILEAPQLRGRLLPGIGDIALEPGLNGQDVTVTISSFSRQ